jgi:lipoyl(octanoyl) transferase
MELRWLGRADYRRVLDDQLAERERVWAGAPGTIFLCEHPPVITLGRSADASNILAPGDVAIERIERGGDVTYHGPGQLMVYPVVQVKTRIVDFLGRVAAALADACAALGAPGAEFHCDPAGIYYGHNKVGACGIHVARGVSVHGFALDVATPPEAWRMIRPCGLSLPQTSVARELEARGLAAVSVERVADAAGPRVLQALL